MATTGKQPNSLFDKLGLSPLRQFKSRKNAVYLVGQRQARRVLKVFRPEGEAKLEFELLRQLFSRGIRVPEPLEFFAEHRALLMEYVPGENLCELLNCAPAPEQAAGLACWFAELHGSYEPDKPTQLKGDAHLRNFLVSPPEKRTLAIVGVDFEEAGCGDPAEDIGHTCSSILNTDPMFTSTKYDLCHTFVDTYCQLTGYRALESIDRQLVRSLRTAARWRPHQREYLLEKAEEIEDRGLLTRG